MYLHGLGVPRDTSTACMWLLLAGNSGKRVLSKLEVPLDKLMAARHRAQEWQAQHGRSSLGTRNDSSARLP
jgi:hypothetical protein